MLKKSFSAYRPRAHPFGDWGQCTCAPPPKVAEFSFGWDRIALFSILKHEAHLASEPFDVALSDDLNHIDRADDCAARQLVGMRTSDSMFLQSPHAPVERILFQPDCSVDCDAPT